MVPTWGCLPFLHRLTRATTAPGWITLPVSDCRFPGAACWNSAPAPATTPGSTYERDCAIVSVDARQELSGPAETALPGRANGLVRSECTRTSTGARRIRRRPLLRPSLPSRESGQPARIHRSRLQRGRGCRDLCPPDRDTSVETGRGNDSRTTPNRPPGEDAGRRENGYLKSSAVHFPFVYHTRTQPSHPEFPVDWNHLGNAPPPSAPFSSAPNNLSHCHL